MNKLLKITVTQVDCFGPGKDRTFTYTAQPQELPEKLRRIRLAFNMERTRIEVA